MNLILYNTPHHLEPLIECDNRNSTNNNQCPASFLTVLGEPLILRNLKIAMKKLNFDKILIPKGLFDSLKVVQDAFPHIDIEEFSDEKDRCYNKKSTTLPSKQPLYTKVTIGRNKISHQNVILDSIIGENVWFGGYSGTANVLLTRGNIRYELRSGDLVDTGTDHFGAVVGNNSAIGASVIILPGRRVPNNTMIQPGTIFGAKKIQSSSILLTKLTTGDST